MKSQIEAYEKGLEQLHAEVRRLEDVVGCRDREIASLRIAQEVLIKYYEDTIKSYELRAAYGLPMTTSNAV
jgi:hypothetical protein